MPCRRPAAAVAALLLLTASATGTRADDIIRHKLPSDFPILSAVEVPPGKTLIFLSGAGAPVGDPAAPARSLAAYGDTRAQTVGTLTAIAATLKGLDLTPGDVVKMTVFLVGDPAKGGRMDFDGFMQGYRQFFGGPGPAPAAHPVCGAGRSPGEPGLAGGDRGHCGPAVNPRDIIPKPGRGHVGRAPRCRRWRARPSCRRRAAETRLATRRIVVASAANGALAAPCGHGRGKDDEV